MLKQINGPNSCCIPDKNWSVNKKNSSVKRCLFGSRNRLIRWTFRTKIVARPRRTYLWFTGIEYSWCTNLAIFVVARFYQCVSLRCSCDALQLAISSRNISIAYHLAKLYWILVEITFFSSSQKAVNFFLYFSVLSLLDESQITRFRNFEGITDFFSISYDTGLRETEEEMRSENAKRVLNVRRVSRWTTGLRENILASASPSIRALVWLSIGRWRDSIIRSIMAPARDENGNRAIAGAL